MQQFAASVIVTLRRSIADVQGKTIEDGLHSLGFSRIRNVRVGKFFHFSVQAASEEEARRIVEQACVKLLANPVIEDFSISLTPEEAEVGEQ